MLRSLNVAPVVANGVVAGVMTGIAVIMALAHSLVRVLDRHIAMTRPFTTTFTGLTSMSSLSGTDAARQGRQPSEFQTSEKLFGERGD